MDCVINLTVIEVVPLFPLMSGLTFVRPMLVGLHCLVAQLRGVLSRTSGLWPVGVGVSVYEPRLRSYLPSS